MVTCGISLLGVLAFVGVAAVDIIAHRGGDPQRPQSSKAAYHFTATNTEAHYLECDLTATRDGVLVCQHEPDLALSSNALKYPTTFTEASRLTELLDPVVDFLADGSSEYIRSDARPHCGWFTPDYPWKGVIENLSAPCVAHQTCFEYETQHYPIARLDDLWQIAEEASMKSRKVGLYLEVKHSTWHQTTRNVDILGLLMDFLEKRRQGLEMPFPVVIQSFEILDLVRARRWIGLDHPSIKLTGLAGNMRGLMSIPSSCCCRPSAFGCDHIHDVPRSMGEMFLSSSLKTPGTCRVTASNACPDTTVCDMGGQVGLYITPIVFEEVDNCDTDRREQCMATLDALWMELTTEACQDLECRKLHSFAAFAHREPPAIFDATCILDCVGIEWKLLSNASHLLGRARKYCLTVHVWTVNSLTDVADAAAIGVDGIFTDYVADAIAKLTV